MPLTCVARGPMASSSFLVSGISWPLAIWYAGRIQMDFRFAF